MVAVLRSIGAMALAALAGAQPASGPPPADCLFSSASAELPGDCVPDPYGVAGDPAVRRAIAQLGLQPAQVELYGCARGRFSTWLVDEQTRTFRINYPLGSIYSFRRYAGPLAHELGHVAQIEETGSIARLRAQLRQESGRVELGADFLAGFMFRRFMNLLDQQAFEQSLDLIGNYATGDRATHSQPEARTAAFRMGFFYAVPDVAARAAHRDFQRNRYGGIINQMLRRP